METITKNQLKGIKKFAKMVINDQVTVDVTQHDWSATQKNIKVLKKLLTNSKLSDYEKSVLKGATYFLYTGFGKKELPLYKGSEIIANEYLINHKFSEKYIEYVISFLKLKSDSKVPQGEAQKIFYDMTNAYFGQKGLLKRITKTWEERNFIRSEKIDLITFKEKKLEFIKEHKFLTAQARKLYNYRKGMNIIKLKSCINKARKQNTLSSNKTALTMFKTALRNHIDLINIADKKAGIMISINAILMTVMIPILGSYIIDISRFIIPSIILILTCGAAVILATLATRPSVSRGNIKEDQKLKGEKSLFYFGNFFNMDKEAYREAVKDVIVRDITLENSIINDLYDLGHILGIKYKRLSWCYLVFASGIALTLVAFLLSYFLIPGF